MLFFQDSRRCRQLNSQRREHRLRIPYSVRFEHAQGLKQSGRDFLEFELGIEVEQRVEIGKRQSGTSEFVELGPQLWDVCCGHGEAAGVGMSAVAGEEVAAGLNGFEQVEGANGAAGPERLF